MIQIYVKKNILPLKASNKLEVKVSKNVHHVEVKES